MGIYDAVRIAGALSSAASAPRAASPATPPKPDAAALRRQAAEEKAAASRLPDRLDEAARLFSRYLVATPAQIDAMVLVAAQTYVLDVLVTTCRGLFTSMREASGKTLAMMMTALLSSNPYDTTGTSYALQSKLAGNDAEGAGAITLFRDEISTVFGTAGLGGNNNPLADILRKGYKRGAKSAWSVNRTNVEFPIFGTFLMTGLRNAVPRDIRSRCIVWQMEQGVPELYFDAREGEARLENLAKALGMAVKGNREIIGAFRGRGLHPKLTGRKLEIWEPLFAVAAAAGQEWLNRCMTAFCELALDESDQPVLSPEQAILRDLSEVVDNVELYPGDFASGMALADELSRIDSPLYTARTQHGIGCLIRDVLPFASVQRRYGEDRVRGYFAADIKEAWENVRPPDVGDVVLPEEADPFEWDDDHEVTDVTDEGNSEAA